MKEISDFLDKEISGELFKHSALSIHKLVEKTHDKAKASCLAKLKAIGISANIASQIEDIDTKSSKFSYIIEASRERRNYLVGGFGLGKSHAISILVQKLTNEYLEGIYTRVPLFAQALEIADQGVQNWAEEKVGTKDYILFIDGLDEIDYSISRKIINEVDYLNQLLVNSLFVVGSRPMNIIPKSDSRIQMKDLSSEEIIELFSIVSGFEKSNTESIIRRLDKNLCESLSKPFFCIICALFKSEPDSWMKSDIDMVTVFIENTIENLNENGVDVLQQLKKLAVLSVNKNLGSVHKSEINIPNVAPILKTGFVGSSDGYLTFHLPIIAQWLASEAIRDNLITVDSILSDEESISRWRYSLSILFSHMTFEESLSLFAKIVNKSPAVASIIIRDGVCFGRAFDLPSMQECGHRVRTCMSVWIDSLGSLSKNIAPMGKDGLYNLAIDFKNSQIAVAWGNQPNEKDIVNITFENQIKKFGSTKINSVEEQSTWPWIITFDYLTHQLKEKLKSRTFFLNNSILENEYVWNITRILSEKNNFSIKRLYFKVIDKYRDEPIFFPYDSSVVNINLYFSCVDRMIKRGINFIEQPYPLPDGISSLDGGFTSIRYSSKRMLEYVKNVYKNALSEYKQLVDKNFSSLSCRMPFYSIYPGKFIGYLNYVEQSKIVLKHPIRENHPATLLWYFSALPIGSETTSSISFEKFEMDNMDNCMSKLFDNNIQQRYDKKKWIHAGICLQVLNYTSCTPVTDIVYRWLEQDLKEIGWLN